MTLSWSQPKTLSFRSPVTSYIITVTEKGASGQPWQIPVDGGDWTERKIPNLKPSTLCSLSIVAVNNKGPGQKTDFPDTETLFANPTPGWYDFVCNRITTNIFTLVFCDEFQRCFRFWFWKTVEKKKLFEVNYLLTEVDFC